VKSIINPEKSLLRHWRGCFRDKKIDRRRIDRRVQHPHPKLIGFTISSTTSPSTTARGKREHHA
jgi:hypothetical protein